MGLGDALQLPKEDIASAVRVLQAPEASAVRNHHGILPGSKWSCLLLRIVLQDALSEVMNIYPPLKLMVFVDDITALVKGCNKEVAEMAKKVMKKLQKMVRRERAR